MKTEKLTWLKTDLNGNKLERGLLMRSDGKRWRARIVRLMANGKDIKQMCRTARTKSDAKRYLKELAEDFEKGGQNAVDASKMKFRQLAEMYRDARLIAPVYDDETSDTRRKERGVASWKDSRAFLETLTAHFGGMLIRNIRHADIEEYKTKRLSEPKQRGGGKRKIAGVHKELEILRACFRFAARRDYLNQSPFDGDTPLISKGDETQRDRVLEFDEEGRLLTALAEDSTLPRPVREDRKYLRLFLIFLLDTAARCKEARLLERRDIDLVNNVITLRSSTTKTMTKRVIPMLTDTHSRVDRLLSPEVV
jgi:integrase